MCSSDLTQPKPDPTRPRPTRRSRSCSRSGDRTNLLSRSRGGDSSMDRRSRSHSRSRNWSNRGDDMCHRTSSFNPSMGEDRGSRHGHYRILDPSFLHPMLNWLNWRTIICPFQTMHHLNSVRTMQWGHYCKLPIPTAVGLFIVVFIVVINLRGK